jgi:glycosyltransferase involved in cell wall biosynthesis
MNTSQAMTITFDSDVWSWQEGGGISRYFIELGKNLEILGHSVRVQAPFHVNEWLRQWKNGDGVYLGDKHGWPFKQALRRLNRAIENVRGGRTDVMHHTAWNANRSHGVPTVVTVHDCVWGQYPDPSYTHQAHRIRKVAREADVIICPSESTRRAAAKYAGLSTDRIHVAYHGTTLLGQPRPARTPTARKIAFVGLRQPVYKNFPILLKALGCLKEVSLCCLGAWGPTEAEIAMAEELDIQDRVQYRTIRSDADLLEGYRDCSALVIPSLEEGFGLPMLEAFALGVPVVASEAEALIEISGGAAAHVDATLPEALAVRILEVLENTELRARLVRDGTKRAADFSWARSAAAHQAAYRAAIDSQL